MISTIDSAGRIVVPKRVREQAKLVPGTPLEIRCRDGVVEIEPASRNGVAGGRSYDALIVACAIRAGVTRVLTLDRRDFEALVPDGIVVDCPLDAT